MFIRELLTFFSNIDTNTLRGNINLGNKNIRSISSYSSNAIYYFPTIVSDQCTAEEVTMISKALEKQYASFVVTCIGLIPFHRISSNAQGSVDEYLKIFHQNIGIDSGINVNLIESAMFKSIEDGYQTSMYNNLHEVITLSENYQPVNEKFERDHLDKYSRFCYNRRNASGDPTLDEAVSVTVDSDFQNSRPGNNITGNTRPAFYEAFDAKSVFTNSDMNKANDAIPTITKVNIGFIVDETNEVIQRDVLVGIKTFVHRISTSELVTNLYNTIINKRKFLKFIKYISGEEKSLSDLLFGINELKADARDTKSTKSSWFQALKRRKRWSKMTIPFLMKSYTPNGTVVMTMNEVEYIKNQYGIDLMKDDHIKMIMDANFLLGFVILDQSNEIAYISYDAHNYEPQEYHYNALEREMNTNDRMMRELYRSFSTR